MTVSLLKITRVGNSQTSRLHTRCSNWKYIENLYFCLSLRHIILKKLFRSFYQWQNLIAPHHHKVHVETVYVSSILYVRSMLKQYMFHPFCMMSMLKQYMFHPFCMRSMLKQYMYHPFCMRSILKQYMYSILYVRSMLKQYKYHPFCMRGMCLILYVRSMLKYYMCVLFCMPSPCWNSVFVIYSICFKSCWYSTYIW